MQIINPLFSNILIYTWPEVPWYKQKKTRPSKSWHPVFTPTTEDENQESNPWKCGTEVEVLWYWMHSKQALCHNRMAKGQYWNSKWHIWAPDYCSSMCDPLKSANLFFLKKKRDYCTKVYTACTEMRYKIVPVTNFNTCYHWNTSAAE